jgi:hypothetical protein
MQFGGIQTGRFADVAEVEEPHVFSWVTNNYWTTNFPARQEGELVWSYRLTSSSSPAVEKAYRAGLAGRVPFLSRVLPGGGETASRGGGSLLRLKSKGVVLLSARPAPEGVGVLLHFREVRGWSDSLSITGGSQRGIVVDVYPANALGETGSYLGSEVPFGPYESRFLLAIPRRPEGKPLRD